MPLETMFVFLLFIGFMEFMVLWNLWFYEFVQNKVFGILLNFQFQIFSPVYVLSYVVWSLSCVVSPNQMNEKEKRKKKSRQKPTYFQKIFLFNGYGGEMTMCTLPLVFYIKFYFYSMGGGLYKYLYFIF